MVSEDTSVDTTYLGAVRSALMTLGSNHPDGDIAASRDFWKHCRDAGVDPQTTAVVIYGSIRHRHTADKTSAQTATLRETSVIERTFRLQYLPANQAWALMYRDSLLRIFNSKREAEIELARIERESKEAVAIARREHPEWFEGEVLNEAPMREEWEVVVRRAGVDPDEITAAAGRRPDQVTSGNAVFAGFFDDEQAVKFASKMTKAGYVATSGPRREYTLHEDVGILSRKERHRLEKEAFDKTPKTHRIMLHNRRTVMIELRPGQRRIDPLDGMTDSELVRYARSVGVKDAHGANEENGDKSAMGDTPPTATEVAPVISEGSKIPWRKVDRDPKQHVSDMALAEKHGPIRNAKQVYELVGQELSKEDCEVFLVIPLNLRGELKTAPYEVARGQRSAVRVDPTDVLRAALDAGAEGYIVVHCHPTGKAKPSKADLDLTDTLKAATKPYGKSLCLLDHVVIGHSEAYSIFERKMYKC